MCSVFITPIVIVVASSLIGEHTIKQSTNNPEVTQNRPSAIPKEDQLSESEKYEVILDTIANFNDLKDSQTGEVITEDDGRVWNMIILKNGIQCIVSYKPGSTNGISCNWEEWNAKKKSAQ